MCGSHYLKRKCFLKHFLNILSYRGCVTEAPPCRYGSRWHKNLVPGAVTVCKLVWLLLQTQGTWEEYPSCCRQCMWHGLKGHTAQEGHPDTTSPTSLCHPPLCAVISPHKGVSELSPLRHKEPFLLLQEPLVGHELQGWTAKHTQYTNVTWNFRIAGVNNFWMKC